MIQPNELRIKNIVKNPRYFKEWGQHLYQTVECICGKDISTNKDDWDADYLEPVELTPDILEAAGFKNGIKTIQTSFLETELYVDLMDGDAGFNKHGLWFPCKHLHQLQNLYWCLCGEELQIDLTKLNKEK